MQYVQSRPLSSYINEFEGYNEVKKPVEVKAVKPVSEHAEPRQLIRPFSQPEQQQTPSKSIEKRKTESYQGDRRVMCRRIKNQSLLCELRSKTDRRRRQQRKSDVAEHIDEVV